MNDHRQDPHRFLKLLGRKRPGKDAQVMLVRERATEREVLRHGPRECRAYLLQRAIEGNKRADGWRYEVVVA